MFPRYRPEIDGLRAIAVILVILFHTQHPIFKGGYVGVDVFFVISGYLITRYVLDGSKKSHFKLTMFYNSRLRRLLPALIATVIATTLFSIILLSPHHLQNFSQTLIASISLLPNIYFYSDAGYFEVSNLFRPLLHYWSLGVEAQFYILWPILLWCLRYQHKQKLALIIGILILISLGSAEYALQFDKNAAFFLLPFRFWEFLCGAACVLADKTPFSNKTLREILSTIALFILGFCLFYFDKKMLFPGLAALPVCFATVLIILIGPTYYVGRILTNQLVVYIGLISYSLYLVHWPIFVLYKYYRVESLTLIEACIMLVSVFLLAAFMYYIIEKPFRQKVHDKFTICNKHFYVSVSGLIILFLGLGVSINNGQGWDWRYSIEIRKAIGNVDAQRERSWADLKKIQNSDILKEEKSLVLFIGDSLSKDAFNAINGQSVNYNLLRLAIPEHCQPAVGKRPFKSRNAEEKSKKCEVIFNDILASEELARAKAIVIAASWKNWAIDRFHKTIVTVRDHTSAPIIIFGTRTKFLDVPSLIIRHGQINGLDAFVNRFQVEGQLKQNKKFIKVVQEIPNIHYVNVIDLFCPNMECPILTPENELIYYDKHHWTLEGAQYFGQLFRSSQTSARNVLFP